jgi:predicted ester cyclase
MNITGTHKCQLGNLMPTGKKTKISGVNIFRFASSEVTEIWNYRDTLDLREPHGVPINAGSKRLISF